MTVIMTKPTGTFIHIPKTAGVAVSQWLKDNANGSWLLEHQHGGKHAPQKRIKKWMDAEQRQMDMGFTFCVVRNPWDRVVSAYHYYVRRHQTSNGKTGIDPLKTTWEEFANREWEHGKWGCVHKPQTTYFDKVDCILRFENLNRDFLQIQNMYNCWRPLFPANMSMHKDYRKYYTNPRWIDDVAEHFKADIKEFGYSFE